MLMVDNQSKEVHLTRDGGKDDRNMAKNTQVLSVFKIDLLLVICIRFR